MGICPPGLCANGAAEAETVASAAGSRATHSAIRHRRTHPAIVRMMLPTAVHATPHCCRSEHRSLALDSASVVLASECSLLYMKNLGLVGSLPDSMSNLSQLESLVLDGNSLVGTIPVLPSLTYVIPLAPPPPQSAALMLPTTFKLGCAACLRVDRLLDATLNLFGSSFLGTAFGGFGSLKTLLVGQNPLASTLPSSLALMTSLQSVHMDNGLLEGTFPTVFSTIPSIRFAASSYNLA
jgi:hypothetical protein